MTDLLSDGDAPTDQTASFDIAAAGAEIGATALQIAYVRCRLLGMTRTRAAKAAGYSGEGATLRSAASKIEKAPAVQTLLRLAEERGAGMPDLPSDRAARRKLLAKMMHGGDKPLAARAMEMLNKMDAEDREAGLADIVIPDPFSALNQLAEISPLVAFIVGRRHNLSPTVQISAEAQRIVERCLADLTALSDPDLKLDATQPARGSYVNGWASPMSDAAA